MQLVPKTVSRFIGWHSYPVNISNLSCVQGVYIPLVMCTATCAGRYTCYNGGVCNDAAYNCTCTADFQGSYCQSLSCKFVCEQLVQHGLAWHMHNAGILMYCSGLMYVCNRNLKVTFCYLCAGEGRCMNGGYCNGFGTCYCSPGYTGSYCENGKINVWCVQVCGWWFVVGLLTAST